MSKPNRPILREILDWARIVPIIWLTLTTLHQAMVRPDLTQTQLIMRIPHSFVLDFLPKKP